MSLEKMVKQMVETMNMPKGTEPYDTTAEVVRVDGDTVWVHIAGGVDETPVKKTIDAVKGDKVQIRVGGGTAWIVGNESKPPTDDREANKAKKVAENADLKAILAKKTADDASKVATNYIDFTEEDGLTVGHKNLESKVNISGDGVKLYDENGKVGTEIKSGEVVVGTEDTNRISLNNGGIILSSIEDVETFKAGVAPNPLRITYSDHIYGDGVPVVLQKVPDTGSTIRVRDYWGYYIYDFTQGTAETKGGFSYDGELTFSCSTAGTHAVIRYYQTVHPPYITFGKRSEYDEHKPYSATFGLDLIASSFQSVFGQYNAEDVNEEYIFIVGFGMDENSRMNALAIGSNGNIKVKGDVYVGCNNDSTGGRKVTSQAQGGVATISVNSNSYAGDTITYPTAYASVPLVVAGLAGTITAYGMGSVSVAVYDVTETNFKVRVYNNSASNRNVTFRWIAIAP